VIRTRVETLTQSGPAAHAAGPDLSHPLTASNVDLTCGSGVLHRCRGTRRQELRTRECGRSVGLRIRVQVWPFTPSDRVRRTG
jgi:hypothetical protein